MDKFEKILDIIDHQEKYSDEEIREILQDEECLKLYQTMQEVDSALLKREVQGMDEEKAGEKLSHGLDIEAEWEKFCDEHSQSDNAEVIPMSPDATSQSRFSWRKIAASIVGFVLVSGIAFAAIHTYVCKSQEPMPIAENAEISVVGDSLKNDTAKVDSASIAKAEKPAVHKTFENVAFDKIMAEIATYYDLQVKFEGNEATSLRLYYDWDSHRKIEEVVKDLNQFENVDVALQGNEIIIK